MNKNKANIWGMHAVAAAWQNPERTVKALYLAENATKEFSKFQAMPGVKRPAPLLVKRKELDQLTGGGVHQGIAMTVTPLTEVYLSDITIKTAQSEKAMLVMLDQVTDPHNVGAILRSACAFGASGIICQRKHAPDLTGVLAKTACGAIEHVPVAFETNLSRAIEALQKENWQVIGLDERGAQEIGIYKDHAKIALVLGAEGAGLRPNVAKHCDTLARLEMHGPMPSINVSNAAAVTMYALTSN